MEKTETKARVKLRTNPNPNPHLSPVVSTGKDIEDVITTRERKQGVPWLSSRNPNPSPTRKPTRVVSAQSSEENVILTRQRKRELMSSSTPKVISFYPTSASNPNPSPTPSRVVLRKRELPSSPTSTIRPPSRMFASNPIPRTQMKLNSPSSSILNKNTCTTTRNIEVITIRDDIPSPIEEEEPKTASFTCLLCCWSKNDEDRFNIKGCGHFYCRDCIEKYVSSKLENNVVVIGCPELGCGSKLELECCQELLPRGVLDRWGDALCETMIQASQKFYCPFKDCSALLVNDGGEIVLESECPYCRRLFCARCRVPWHAEIKCEEFQRFNKEEQYDLKMKALAEKENWARCPICNFYVQKISGCNFIRCRCGTAFCYLCGKRPLADHYCAYCRR